jgi:hypothetical protein
MTVFTDLRCTTVMDVTLVAAIDVITDWREPLWCTSPFLTPHVPHAVPKESGWVDMVLDAATGSLTGLCGSSVHHSFTHPRCPTTVPLTGMSHFSSRVRHSSQSHHSFQSVTCPRCPMLSQRRESCLDMVLDAATILRVSHLHSHHHSFERLG